MIIVYWCTACRELHGAGEIEFPTPSDEHFRCLSSGQAVLPRGIADDPDDEHYGETRCPLCQRPRGGEAGVCPDCGSN
ncbi:hypothetical protein BURK2_03858 [Burkholderiales bacterium]|nr:MAG: hypothetical protein F9K47_17330 [Burkholderiales bacterium]CAG1009274.1 hypothetical protein BURK2_03858 [Burkholderiales bacterium]